MNGLFLLNMCKSCFVFFKLGRNQISTLSSPNSLLSRSQILLLTSSWQLDVLMLVEGWWHMMVPGITTGLLHNTAAKVRHSARLLSWTALARIRGLAAFYLTVVVLLSKQTWFVITSSRGYIGGNARVVLQSSDSLAVNDGGAAAAVNNISTVQRG